MKNKTESTNGVPVYYEFNNNLHSAETDLYIRCGSMYEPKELNGITHLFEHTVFRNINKLMNGNLYRELDKHAVRFNASTYKEFMYFGFTYSSESLDFVIDILKMIFAEIILSPGELSVEKNVIKSEIYEDSERTTLLYAANQAIWGNTSLSQTISGTSGALNKITVSKLNKYKNELFSSGDIFICTYGDICKDTATKIAAALSETKIKQAPPLKTNIAPIPENFRNRQNNIIIKKAGYTRVKLCFEFDNSDGTVEAVYRLFDCIFDGEACPFILQLKENKGLIYSYNALLERYANIGCIKVGFDIQRKNIESALETTVEILNSIKNEDFDYKTVEVLYNRRQQEVIDQVDSYCWDQAYFCHICSGERSSDDINKQYNSLTIKDIAKAAERIFRTSHMTIAIKSEGTLKKEKITDIMNKLDI